MRSTIKTGPRTVGLKKSKAKALKANPHSLWDALNKSAANTCGGSISPEEVRALIKKAVDENAAEMVRQLKRQGVLA